MNKLEKPSTKAKPINGLKNDKYKKYAIKLPVGIYKSYPSNEWFLVSLPDPLFVGDKLYIYQIVDSIGIIVRLITLADLDHYEEVIRIHNENLLLGISDEAYNETVNEV